MLRYLTRTTLPIFMAVALLLLHQSAAAQANPRIAAILAESGALTLVTFDTNGQVTPLRVLKSSSAVLSPDGRHFAQVLYDENAIEYGALSGSVRRLAIPAFESVLADPVFDRRSETLLFTTANFRDSSWTLYFVSMNGAVRTLKAREELLRGALITYENWDSTSSRLLTRRAVPFTDRIFTGLFSIDLSIAAPSASGTSITQRAIAQRSSVTDSLFFLPSPDQNYAVEALVDCENPVEGYPRDGLYFPLSGLILYNLSNGSILNLNVPRGEGIGRLVWAADSSAFYFTAGRHNQTTSPVAPTLYQHRIGGETKRIATLSNSRSQTVSDLAVCGTQVFYVLKSATDFQSPSTLQTLTLGSGDMRTLYRSSGSIKLLGCLQMH